MRLRTILGCAVLLLAGACSSDNCKSAHDCAPADRCVAQVCRKSSETVGAIGDSCAATSECGPGMTCDTPGAGFPNGFCTASCASGTACSDGACVNLAGGDTCAATCSTDTDCRNGYLCCGALGNVCVPTSQCIPPTCQRPVVPPAPGMQVLAQAPHQKVGTMVPFTVPAGTGSISIVQQAEIANLEIVYKGQVLGNSAVPGVILMPDGGRAYDDNDQAFQPAASPDGGVDPSGIYSYFGGDTPTTGAFTIPNTNAALTAGVPSGNWQFQVNDYAYECAHLGGCSDGGVDSNIYDVTVLGKAAPATSATATVDVAFYIIADVTTGTGAVLNDTTAPNDPSVKRMLSTFQKIYANAGITIGNVSYYYPSAAVRSRFGTHINADLTGPCDELNQMFTISGDHPGNTLNLFLVQSITSTDVGGGPVVGIDGTIPGPSGFMGTVHSGAAVSIADLFKPAVCGPSVSVGNCGADAVAFIAAHEAGHFLGLFHTTEQDGRFFDSLTDTSKCPCTQCASAGDLPNCATGGTASNPVLLFATQCTNAGAGCGGGDNFMFWQLSATASQGTVTPQQGAVIRLNPVVK